MGGRVDLRTVQRQQRLVGGDDVFTRRQRREDRLPGRVRAAD